MASYVRGSKLFFSAAFVDAAGAPATPISATLYITFANLNLVRESVSVSMSVVGNVASASWDSSVAADCTVQWSVKGTGANAIVTDGSLRLTANEANPTS